MRAYTNGSRSNMVGTYPLATDAWSRENSLHSHRTRLASIRPCSVHPQLSWDPWLACARMHPSCVDGVARSRGSKSAPLRCSGLVDMWVRIVLHNECLVPLKWRRSVATCVVTRPWARPPCPSCRTTGRTWPCTCAQTPWPCA